MKRLVQLLGIAAFWLTFPVLVIYLSRGPRTRLVIRCGDTLVMVKGWLGTGRWILPGGGLHTGEAPLDGVLREVREETGLRLDRAQVKPLMTEPYRFHGIHFLCHYFIADLPEELLVHPQLLEISEVAWVDCRQLVAGKQSPDVAAALRQLNLVQ